MTYLNTNDDGKPSPFSNLTVCSTPSAYTTACGGWLFAEHAAAVFQDQ